MSDGSLENKLSKLMMALRGVDPEKLAEKQQQQQKEVEVVEKKQEPSIPKNDNDDNNQDQEEKIVVDASTKLVGDFDDLQVLEVRTTKKVDVPSQQQSTADSTIASFSVENLMKQYVSTLRQDIQSGKTEVVSTNTNNNNNQQSSLPDYSAMSMEELLDQIDEMVDATTSVDLGAKQQE